MGETLSWEPHAAEVAEVAEVVVVGQSQGLHTTLPSPHAGSVLGEASSMVGDPTFRTSLVKGIN